MISKYAPVRVEMSERRAEVARLRRAGLTQTAIAEQVGVSRGTVVTDLSASMLRLQEVADADMGAWRSAQLNELQEARSRLWELLGVEQDGSKAASLAGSIVRLCEREARLLGMDKPTKVHVGAIHDTMTEAEALAILAEEEPLTIAAPVVADVPQMSEAQALAILAEAEAEAVEVVDTTVDLTVPLAERPFLGPGLPEGATGWFIAPTITVEQQNQIAAAWRNKQRLDEARNQPKRQGNRRQR